MSKELDPTAMNADQAEAALGLTPKPASPTAVLDEQRPIPPLVAQADTASGGAQQPVQPATPEPDATPQPTGGIEPMPAMPIPMQQPAAPKPLDYQTPAQQSLPVLPKYESVQNKAVPATPIPTGSEDDHWLDQHVFTPVGQFGRGLISGGIEAASVGRRAYEALAGETHAPKDDWQNQDEASLSKEELASGAHRFGAGVGSTAAYMAGAAPVLAALPFELPTAAGIAGVGATIAAKKAAQVIASRIAIAAAATEGAAINTASGLQDRGRKGEPTTAGDVALDAGIGGLTGGGFSLAGQGLAGMLKRAFRSHLARKAIKAKNDPGRLQGFVRQTVDLTDEHAEQAAEQIANDFHQAEMQQTKAAHEALGPEPAETPLQRKQQQVMDDEQLLKLFDTKRDTPEGDAALARLRKLFPGRNNAQIVAMAKAARARSGAQPPTGAEPPTAPKGEQPQGPTRMRRNKIGFERIEDAEPLADVLAKLPLPLAAKLDGAVKAIGAAKALVGHLENQVMAYSENVYIQAATPQEKQRVKQVVGKKLKSTIQEQIAKHRSDMHLAEMQQKLELEAEIARLSAQLTAEPTRSAIRQTLFDTLNRAKANLTKLGLDRELLKLSDPEKHAHVIADRSPLTGGIQKLADGFHGAEAQLETAEKALHRAQKVLDALREKHLPTFKDVDDALGEHTPVKVMISHFTDPTEQTMMAVGRQHNSSESILVGKYLTNHKRFMASLTKVADNYNFKLLYESTARALNTNAKEAEAALRAEGHIHPKVKPLLLAAAIGWQGLNAPNAEAAEAAGAEGHNPNYPALLGWGAGGIGSVMVATILDRKFGGHGARIIARSMEWLAMRWFDDTHNMLPRADRLMGIVDPAESLQHFLTNWRGAHIRRTELCPDDHTLLNKVLQGTATAPELRVFSADGHRYVAALHAYEDLSEDFVSDYHQRWNDHYSQFSDKDKRHYAELDATVDFVEKMFGHGKLRPAKRTFLDNQLAGVVKRTSAYAFSKNPKLVGAMYLHDVPAIGGMVVGPTAAQRARLTYTGDAHVRALANKLELGGRLSEALDQKKPIWVEAAHNRMAFLASLEWQFAKREPELRAAGVKNVRDFQIKSMTAGQLPDHIQRETYDTAGTHIMQMTSNDPLGVNRSPVGRSPQFGILAFYTRMQMAEALVWKQNTQSIIAAINNGDYATALQQAGWMSHALLVKQQFAGRAVIPVSATALLMNNPYTAEATAQIMELLNNYSLGLHVLGDQGGMAKWDPFLAPLSGVIAPGMEEKLQAVSDMFGGFQKIQKMNLVLARPNGVRDLVAGSKQDPDVAEGQRAFKALIVGIGNLWPELLGIPVRAIGTAVQHYPDLQNNEHIVNVRSTLPLGNQHNVQSNKIMYYNKLPGQTQADVKRESQVDAVKEMFGFGPSIRAVNREGFIWAEKAMKGPTAKTEAGVARSGLSE